MTPEEQKAAKQVAARRFEARRRLAWARVREPSETILEAAQRANRAAAWLERLAGRLEEGVERRQARQVAARSCESAEHLRAGLRDEAGRLFAYHSATSNEVEKPEFDTEARL